MTNQQYYTCISELSHYTDIDAYVSDLALSSMWDDDPDEEIATGRIADLTAIYEAAHRNIRDIASLAGMSVRQLAFRFGIPQRTVESWSTDERTCATYTLLMMQECLGQFNIERH